MVSVSLARSSDSPLCLHRLIASWRIGLKRFSPFAAPNLPPFAIMPPVTRGPQPNHPRMQTNSLDPGKTAVRRPEPQTVAHRNTGDAIGRKEQLAQVFPSPPVAPEPVLRHPVQ